MESYTFSKVKAPNLPIHMKKKEDLLPNGKQDKIFSINNKLILYHYRTQDIFIVLSYVLFGFSFYSTYVYEAGVADILYKKFRLPLAAITFYFILSVGHHFWIILNHQKHPHINQWPAALTGLFIIQRLFSPIYYYLYKRTALRMSDPRFHENMDWIAEQLSIK